MLNGQNSQLSCKFSGNHSCQILSHGSDHTAFDKLLHSELLFISSQISLAQTSLQISFFAKVRPYKHAIDSEIGFKPESVMESKAPHTTTLSQTQIFNYQVDKVHNLFRTGCPLFSVQDCFLMFCTFPTFRSF